MRFFGAAVFEVRVKRLLIMYVHDNTGIYEVILDESYIDLIHLMILTLHSIWNCAYVIYIFFFIKKEEKIDKQKVKNKQK